MARIAGKVSIGKEAKQQKSVVLLRIFFDDGIREGKTGDMPGHNPFVPFLQPLHSPLAEPSRPRGATLFGFVLWWHSLSPPNKTLRTLATPLHTGLVILTFSTALAPVLHSLLDTVSTDTIYAMTFLFLLLNWTLSPYGNGMCRRDPANRDSNVISLAAGLLASLCLASRLSGPWETLILILFATLMFATWPSVAHSFQVPGKHAVCTVVPSD
ncbi:hypothetical protein SprV_0501886200 [Sparganum proliferum]